MIIDILNLNGHGVFVWPSFIFPLIVCYILFLRTKKTLSKLEKENIKEIKILSQQKFEHIKKQKISLLNSKT